MTNPVLVANDFICGLNDKYIQHYTCTDNENPKWCEDYEIDNEGCIEGLNNLNQYSKKVTKEDHWIPLWFITCKKLIKSGVLVFVLIKIAAYINWR